MSYLFNDKVSVGGEPVRTINENQSQFGETRTVNRTPVIELDSSYGTSMLRDIETVSGSGTIISSEGKITLSTGTTANSTSILDSAEVGRYMPGFSAEIGIGVRLPSLPSGNQSALWGGLSYNNENGFYFGIDATGLYVARISGGVEDTKFYQENFNIDKLNGSGISKYNINVTDGIIYQIDFTWYGYGQILFGIVGILPDNENVNGRNKIQKFIPCHSMQIKGSVSTFSPNLKIHAEIGNGTDATNYSMDVGGRQYSIVGEYDAKYRYTNDFRGSTNTSTTVSPLISFTRKEEFRDRSIKLEGFDIIAATEPCIVEVIVNGTLTGASFGTPTDHTASETALVSDTSATAISGGMVVWQQLIDAGTNKNSAELATNDVAFDIPNNALVTLAIRTISGTGTAVSSFRLREEW